MEDDTIRDPRPMSRVGSSHALAVFEIASARCSGPDCEHYLVGVMPLRTQTGIDVYWCCVDHGTEMLREQPSTGEMSEIAPVCGAPAAPHPADAPCGVSASHLAIIDVDGVAGLRTVSLCSRHAGEAMDALP